MGKRTAGTSTRAFGAGARESHDAGEFYQRFSPPIVSTDEQINPCSCPDSLFLGDSREMGVVNDASVALVVTSPPYFAGKEYELALGEGHVPGSYLEYLEMLSKVFAECVRVLEPGGRIAVNVANLGRKPYRSLAGDVVRILQDELGLLMRGEVIWVKAEGASGSCAWGSFQSAANPVLRDTSERVIIASKGRFDRAIKRAKRMKLALPHENTISKEEFMAATLDVWRIRPASAKKVGHPAPFPLELPARLIQLLTYAGDVVLDPFIGSGSAAVAATMAGRHFIGFDTDAGYLELAKTRLVDEAGYTADLTIHTA
jgi:modification methylase